MVVAAASGLLLHWMVFDGSSFLTALPMGMRDLALAIAGMCVVEGGLAFLFMFALDSFLLRFGSATLITIVFGLLIGLPGYYLCRAVLGRKTIPCSVGFGKDRLTIETESKVTTIPHGELERLVWRNVGDYARVEVHGRGQALSLLVGMARTPKTVLPQLPPLPPRTIRRLRDAGMETQPSRRPGVVILAAARSSTPAPC